MLNKPSRAGATLWMAACLLCAASVLAQQKQRLQDRSVVGDCFVVKSNFDMDMTLKSTAGEQELPSLKFASQEREKYTEEVLAAEGGKTSAFRRVYTQSRSVETDPNGEKKETTSPLQGKTVTVRRVGGKATVTATTGKLDEASQKSLIEDLEQGSMDFFPDREIGPGDEWEVDSGAVTKLFEGAEKATIKGRFVDEVQFEGHPCVRVHVTMDLQIKSPDMPVPAQLKLEGDLHHATDIQRTVSMEVSGPLTIQGETKENGAVITFTGEGTMRMKMTQQWLKAGGKPVGPKPGTPN